MNKTQLELLEGYIGEEGNYTSTILEANQPDIPTKILYLKKAITEDPIKFKQSLDELKESLELEEPNTSAAEVIRSLKVIHDLYCNNELDYAYGGYFSTTKKVSALNHFFHGTGEIKPEEFRQEIQSSIEKFLKHPQFTAEFWKKRIQNEFILRRDNLDEIENSHANKEDPLVAAKFWQGIYQQIEKETYKHIPPQYLSSIKAVVKGEDAYFKDHAFLYEYLYCYLENAKVEGINGVGGDLIDFAIRRNNQNLLDLMFKTISPLDKHPGAGYAVCLQHMGNSSAGYAVCLQHMGNSSLHQAVALRQMSVLKKLVCEQKVDVNLMTYSLQTPLALACRYGHLEVVEFLLANNANVNQGYGVTQFPLQVALENQHFAIAKLLVDKGANILIPNALASQQTPIQQLIPEDITKNSYQVIKQTLSNDRRNERQLNSWEKATLRELQAHGLTAQMLLERREGREFDNEDSWALCDLVLKRGFSLANAFAEIGGLSSDQVHGIKEGLSRNDVLPLSNFWHIAALIDLKEKGLTAQMLLDRNENGHKFDAGHCWALRNLVRRGFTIANALVEIEGLSERQAYRIKEGETREQVLVGTAPSLDASSFSFNF
jgi:hypothetical protein